MKNFLTLLIAMLLLLPTAMHGADKKVVTSIDITIPLPKDGMGIEDGEQIQITAAKTAYGDLVQQGIASVFSILWEARVQQKKFRFSQVSGRLYVSCQHETDARHPESLHHQVCDARWRLLCRRHYAQDYRQRRACQSACRQPLLPPLQFCGYRAWRRWRQSQEGEPVL